LKALHFPWRSFVFLLLKKIIQRPMQPKPIKEGDKVTFQWRPGYRGPLRDGETVFVLAVNEGEIKVRYRLNQEETLRAEHLYHSGSALK
jgi:hypothetical protein